MTPATLTALACELRNHLDQSAANKAAAILEQVAGADAGCPVVGYRHSSTHCLYETEAEVELADGDSWVENLVLEADHLAALTAQSGDGVALYEALKGVVRVADRKTDEFDAARAAIAAYEAKRGGVR